MRTFNSTSSVAALRLGRMIEGKLTRWSERARAEMLNVERAGGDPCPLLAMGIAVLRARQSIRTGIQSVQQEGQK